MGIWTFLFGRRSVGASRSTLPQAAPGPGAGRAQRLPRRGPPGARGGDPRQHALHEAFTPTRPQRSFRRLAGRKEELRRILEAVSQNRGHVVLYGERGRGKTSLMNLVASSARSSGYAVGRYSCAEGSDLDEIMRGLARDLPRSLLAVPVVEEAGLEGCEAALPRGTIQPRDIAQFPSRLSASHLLLVIDEFDRVTDVPTRTRLADAIKQISDRSRPAELPHRRRVGQSRGAARPPPLDPAQRRRRAAAAALRRGMPGDPRARIAGKPGSPIRAEIRAKIVELSRGVPYVVQLLGLHAGERALARQAEAVSAADLRGAIEQAATEMDPRIRVLYEELTQGELDGGTDAPAASARSHAT